MSKIIIYQAKNGSLEFKGDLPNETIWATQEQIVRIFEKNQSVISRHIKNILSDEEVDEKSNMQKMHIANSDKPVQFYSLDIILAVGYRVNSKKAIEFRKWATSVLRDHITKGYTINRKQIQKNYQEFLKTVENIQNLLPEHVALDPKSILELIKEFSGTWLSLDAYDKESLKVIGKTKKSIKFSGQELTEAIKSLRSELLNKGEATDIFAQERTAGSIEGMVGNIMQSFGGKDVYPSIEEKSAHLLYFIVKNHPFVDGNKRSGAFAFVWFLRKTKAKGFRNINQGALITQIL